MLLDILSSGPNTEVYFNQKTDAWTFIASLRKGLERYIKLVQVSYEARANAVKLAIFDRLYIFFTELMELLSKWLDKGLHCVM